MFHLLKKRTKRDRAVPVIIVTCNVVLAPLRLNIYQISFLLSSHHHRRRNADCISADCCESLNSHLLFHNAFVNLYQLRHFFKTRPGTNCQKTSLLTLLTVETTCFNRTHYTNTTRHKNTLFLPTLNS